MGSEVLLGSMMGYLWLYGRYSALAILPPARMTLCESRNGHNFANFVSSKMYSRRMKRKSPGFSSLEIHKNRTTNARDMILGSTYRRKLEPLVKKLEKFQRNRDKSYD